MSSGSRKRDVGPWTSRPREEKPGRSMECSTGWLTVHGRVQVPGVLRREGDRTFRASEGVPHVSLRDFGTLLSP